MDAAHAYERATQRYQRKGNLFDYCQQKSPVSVNIVIRVCLGKVLTLLSAGPGDPRLMAVHLKLPDTDLWSILSQERDNLVFRLQSDTIAICRRQLSSDSDFDESYLETDLETPLTPDFWQDPPTPPCHHLETPRTPFSSPVMTRKRNMFRTIHK